MNTIRGLWRLGLGILAGIGGTLAYQGVKYEKSEWWLLICALCIVEIVIIVIHEKG